MAGKVVNSSFVLLSKFGVSRQEIALKTATSHIRKPLCAMVKRQRCNKKRIYENRKTCFKNDIKE